MKCEAVHGCEDEVVAKIGLPSRNAIWVCLKHFNQWRDEQERRWEQWRPKG